MRIIKGGFQSIIVDGKRSGVRHLGYTQAAASDVLSHTLANVLLGKSAQSSSIEIFMGGLSVEFEHTMLICISGAPTDVRLNRQNQAYNTPILVHAGDVLDIDEIKQGARAYLSLSKEFACKTTLNSQTTSVSEGLGGHLNNGQSLQAGNIIEISSDHSFKSTDTLRHKAFHNYQRNYQRNMKVIERLLLTLKTDIADHYCLNYLPSYQYSAFSSQNRVTFNHQTYTVTHEFNRMGLRLNGRPMDTSHISNSMYSEGITLGAIQIPASGVPIIMLQERQTIGGYPKIASLCHKSVDVVGQCRPENTVEFVETDLYSVREQRVLEQYKLAQILALINGDKHA